MTLTFPQPSLDVPALARVRQTLREVRRKAIHIRDAARIELLDRFESLGDNCEFASLQKAGGVSTPALFKWTATTPGMLAEVIDADLAGIDDPANLELDTAAHDGEYRLFHRLYGSLSHTFVRMDAASPEQVLQRERRRLTMLKRKFLEDARDGRRTYVFRNLAPASATEVAALAEALARQGPNTLLWVRAADDARQAGLVERRSDALLEARLDRLASYDAGMTVLSRMWPVVLRRASQFHDAAHGFRALASAA